jgi:hypothetical protein
MRSFCYPLKTVANITGVFFAAYLIMAAEPSLACASCGSGGDDPLILYPSEAWKSYVGLSRSGDIQSYDHDDQEIMSLGLTSKSTTLMSVGRGFNRSFFGTLTVPYIVNRRGEYERSGWGDPLLALRYTLVQQTLEDERIPQIQLMAAYRPSYATSIYDAKDPALLDVRGSGVPEGRLGVDVWYGMLAWKGGLAQTVAMPLEDRETDFGRKMPGTIYRSTATIGYGWGPTTKALLGLNREYTTRFKIDGEARDRTDSLSHNVFVTGEGQVSRDTILRVNWTRNGAIFKHYNASRSQTVSISAIKTF